MAAVPPRPLSERSLSPGWFTDGFAGASTVAFGLHRISASSLHHLEPRAADRGIHHRRLAQTSASLASTMSTLKQLPAWRPLVMPSAYSFRFDGSAAEQVGVAVLVVGVAALAGVEGVGVHRWLCRRAGTSTSRYTPASATTSPTTNTMWRGQRWNRRSGRALRNPKAPMSRDERNGTRIRRSRRPKTQWPSVEVAVVKLRRRRTGSRSREG